MHRITLTNMFRAAKREPTRDRAYSAAYDVAMDALLMTDIFARDTTSLEYREACREASRMVACLFG